MNIILEWVQNLQREWGFFFVFFVCYVLLHVNLGPYTSKTFYDLDRTLILSDVLASIFSNYSITTNTFFYQLT